MAKFRSQLNRSSAVVDKLAAPKWSIGFKYQMCIIDRKGNVKIDQVRLMGLLGFTQAFDECTSYFALYPASLAEPQSQNMDDFFEHLCTIGIYSKVAPFGFEQTEQTEAIYEKILTA